MISCDCYRNEADFLDLWLQVLEPPRVLQPLKQLALLLRASTLVERTLQNHFPGLSTYNARLGQVGMESDPATTEVLDAWNCRNKIIHDAFVPGRVLTIRAISAFASADFTVHQVDPGLIHRFRGELGPRLRVMFESGTTLDYAGAKLLSSAAESEDPLQRGIPLIHADTFIEIALLALARKREHDLLTSKRFEEQLALKHIEEFGANGFRKLNRPGQILVAESLRWCRPGSLDSGSAHALRERNDYAHGSRELDSATAIALAFDLYTLADTLRGNAIGVGVALQDLEPRTARDAHTSRPQQVVESGTIIATRATPQATANAAKAVPFPTPEEVTTALAIHAALVKVRKREQAKLRAMQPVKPESLAGMNRDDDDGIGQRRILILVALFCICVLIVIFV